MKQQTIVHCVICDKGFKTERKKSPGEVFNCTHCGQKYYAMYDECNESWLPAEEDQE